MTDSPTVDAAWARRYGVPGSVRSRLQEIEKLTRAARAAVAAREQALPTDPTLEKLRRLIDAFLDDQECGALAAALRRDATELAEGAVGRRILESAFGTLDRSVKRAIEADDLRRALLSRVREVQGRFGVTVPWHLARALEEYQLGDLSYLRSRASMRRGEMVLDIIEKRLLSVEQEVTRTPARILEQVAWPPLVSVAELAHAAARRAQRVVEHPSLRSRLRLRRALAAQTNALLGPRGTGVLTRASERLSAELLLAADSTVSDACADLEASAILLRGAARMRSAGDIRDPIVSGPAAPADDRIGIAALFGPFVLIRRGMPSPVEVIGERVTCGMDIRCQVRRGGDVVSRPIDEWGSPLFDHPDPRVLRAVRSTSPAEVRVFARLEQGAWLGQVVTKGTIESAGPELPQAERVFLALERRELRPHHQIPTSAKTAAPAIFCGIRRERVDVPVRDRPEVSRQSAMSGHFVELLDSEWQFLMNAVRRSRVAMPRPIGIDALTQAYLYDVPVGLSLGWSSSLRELRERDPAQLIGAIAALWKNLHEDVLRERRPNSLALGLYHEKTIHFRPMIGVERDALQAVVVAAPMAVLTDTPYPWVPDDLPGAPTCARLGGPPLTRWLGRWGVATHATDARMALLFMLEILAKQPLRLPENVGWEEFVEALSARAQEDASFIDNDQARKMADGLTGSDDELRALLERIAADGRA